MQKYLRSRLSELRARNVQDSELARAVQAGEVDAVVVLRKDGARVFPIQTDEPLYRTMVEALPHGMATVLSDGTFVYANQYLINTLGKEGDQLLGQSILPYVHPADRAMFSAMLEKAVSTPQELEVRFLWDAGSGPVLISATRLGISGVDAMGLAIIDVRDQLARRDAEDAIHAKDELLAAVSHELRTPLTSMVGWVQLLEQEVAGNEWLTEAVHNLKNAVTAETRIVDDLLDLSRSSRGSLPMHVLHFDVRECIRTAASFVQLQARAKAVNLHLAIPDEPLPISGDPDRIRQVFVNLLTNAVKFTHAPGKVELRVAREDGHVQVAVKDSGMGISRDFLPFVFEPFRRGDAAQDYPGLGIGLAIAKRLIEAHGGSIRASSEGLGRGATFTVTLPLR